MRSDHTVPRSRCRPAPAGWAVRVLAGIALAGGLAAGAARAGVTVALQPATQTVSAGAQFDLFLTVTQSGSPFNAFDAIVGHDPAALTLVPLSPLSLQEGPLMTGACGSRFHQFRHGADRDTATDVLLCNGVSVSGPGQIYRLHFQASSTPQTTTVQLLPGVRFFDAGIGVNPVSTSDASVVIVPPVAVGPAVSPPASTRLRVGPNPSRGLTRIRLDTEAAGPLELAIRDLMGRHVRQLAQGWFTSGRREVVWDGRDDAGAPLPPGMYYAELWTPRGAVRAPIVRLP